jgi:asparagine synthase (glutamine-hydrolysing)
LHHRRLAILDLSNCAAQPMTDPVGGQVLVFNGEIYNYGELRSRLQARGQAFTSTGDTEVMLRLLAMEGWQSSRELRGMFAYALWDGRKRELVLGRDPLGIKPLYVCFARDVGGDESAWTMAFASEVRALLSARLIPHPRLDPSAVASMVWNGFVTGPGTIVRGVQTLWPGEVVVLDAHSRRTGGGSIWSIPAADPTPGSTDRAASELAKSVRLHLCSDVPLGVFLSAGIDSSTVANLAKRAGTGQVRTFTLAFEEQAINEGREAARIAAAIGTEHTEVLLTESMFVSSLGEACDALDQPSFDGINSYFMSRAVREAGLTVALVGTGGDELFGGYRSFRELPRLLALGRAARPVPASLVHSASRLLARWKSGGSGADVGPQTRWAKLPDMIRAGGSLLSLYQLAYALFLPSFQREMLREEIGVLQDGLPGPMRDRIASESGSMPTLAAISAMEQRLFLGERLLRDADAASMAVSLETRLPLVDSVLTEGVAGLPESERYRPVGRKQFLRTHGLAGLDPALFERPKTGFVLPFDTWIRRGLGVEMDRTMRDEPSWARVGLQGTTVRRLWDAYQSGAPGMYWSRVWSIYMLMRWCQRQEVWL